MPYHREPGSRRRSLQNGIMAGKNGKNDLWNGVLSGKRDKYFKGRQCKQDKLFLSQRHIQGLTWLEMTGFGSKTTKINATSRTRTTSLGPLLHPNKELKWTKVDFYGILLSCLRQKCVLNCLENFSNDWLHIEILCRQHPKFLLAKSIEPGGPCLLKLSLLTE